MYSVITLRELECFLVCDTPTSCRKKVCITQALHKMKLLISNKLILNNHIKYSGTIRIGTVIMAVTTGECDICISYKSEKHLFLPQVLLAFAICMLVFHWFPGRLSADHHIHNSSHTSDTQIRGTQHSEGTLYFLFLQKPCPPCSFAVHKIISLNKMLSSEKCFMC